MNNELSVNNLFGYATSELSQDAFICWFLSYATDKGWDKNTSLRDCAKEFLNDILSVKGLSFDNNKRVTSIKRQYKNIDILISIDDVRIIIEDKTFTDTHDNQINRYRNVLVDEGIDENNIFCVYYKIIEQPYLEAGVNFEFTRSKLLDLFNRYQSTDCFNNDIFKDYVEYLKWIDSQVNSFSSLPIKEWKQYQYKGFFEYIKNVLLKDESVSWGYVPNQSGGFMGLWWYDILDNDSLNNLGLTEEICDNIYIQFENDIICIKYSLEDEVYRELGYDMTKVKSIRWQLYDYFKSKLGDDFNKKSFQNGRCMTIGFVSYDEKNYSEKLTSIKAAIDDMITEGFKVS